MTDNQTTDLPEGDTPKTGADPATRVEESVKEAYRTLDDFTPTQREFIEDYKRKGASKAINDFKASAKDSGTAVTKADVDALLKQRDEEYAARDNARSEMERTLIQDHGIAVGSPEYDKFAAASARFKTEELRSKEGIAAIVKSAGLDKADEGQPDPITGIRSLYKPKAYDGSPLEGMPPSGIALDMSKHKK
jgi:hypothetical protein